LKKTLEPTDITAVIDTREQRPLDLSPLKSIPGTLVTGDYSVLGLEQEIAIERKSLSDLLGCIGKERERFDKEIKRLIGYPVRALVVEASWSEIEAGMWLTQGRCQVLPQTALGSLLGWIAYGVPVIMAGSHQQASLYVSRMLFIAARRRWHQLYDLQQAVEAQRGGTTVRGKKAAAGAQRDARGASAACGQG
jgi:DNA excision repair protein ERCC-4